MSINNESESTYMYLSYVHLESVLYEIEKKQDYILIDMYRQELSKKFEHVETFDEEYNILKKYFGYRITPITDTVYRLTTFPDNYKFDFDKNQNILIQNFLGDLNRKSAKLINQDHLKKSKKQTMFGYQSFSNRYTSSYSFGLNIGNTFKIKKKLLKHYQNMFREYILAEIEKDRNRLLVHIVINLEKDKYPKKMPHIIIDDIRGLMDNRTQKDLDENIQKLLSKLKGQVCLYYVESFISYYLSNIAHVEDVLTGTKRKKLLNCIEKLASYNDKVEIPTELDIKEPENFIGNIYEIIKKMPRGIKINNIETILRPDLIFRFRKYEAMLKNKYKSTSGFTKMDIAFHGTRHNRLHDIVEKGLIIPNLDNGLDAFTCGARYGNGIYLSPNSRFSMHYCRGDSCLLVCAVLPGKKYTCSNNMWDKDLTNGYDSHISSDGTELILFDEAQVLPCIVIHFTTNEYYEDWWDFVNKPNNKRVKYRDQMKTMNPKEKKEFLASFGFSTLPFGFGKNKKCEFLDVTFPDDSDDEDVVWYGDIDNEQYNIFQDSRFKLLETLPFKNNENNENNDIC
jgi:hypothetical protein